MSTHLGKNTWEGPLFDIWMINIGHLSRLFIPYLTWFNGASLLLTEVSGWLIAAQSDFLQAEQLLLIIVQVTIACSVIFIMEYLKNVWFPGILMGPCSRCLVVLTIAECGLSFGIVSTHFSQNYRFSFRLLVSSFLCPRNWLWIWVYI